MDKKRIVFMGTPIFAAKILDFLLHNKINIVGVVTQPDRLKDRKGNVTHTPVKEVALNNNLEVFQPVSINKDTSFLELLKPDLIITVAYGQIVSESILKYPQCGCINVHGSLLPKYRGGAPIHYAILNGDDKTGVTIMEMVKKMDAGNIISQESFEISKDDTLEVVHDKMIVVGQELLLKTLPKVLDQSYESIVQDEAQVTYSPVISKEEQLIDFTEEGRNIYNKIRAFNPWPVAYARINGLRFKFFETKYIENFKNNVPGKISSITEEGIFIGVKGGYLKVLEFQIEGKKKMKVKDFVNGNNLISEGDDFLI